MQKSSSIEQCDNLCKNGINSSDLFIFIEILNFFLIKFEINKERERERERGWRRLFLHDLHDATPKTPRPLSTFTPHQIQFDEINSVKKNCEMKKKKKKISDLTHERPHLHTLICIVLRHLSIVIATKEW